MKIYRLIAVLILAGLFAAGCTPAAQPAEIEPGMEPTAALVEPTAPAEAQPTAVPENLSGFSVTDALGREVTFTALPQRIVIAGKATSLLVNAFYLFPESSGRVIAIEKRLQTGADFLPLADPQSDQVTPLEQDASAEQIAPLNPDLVILKSVMAEKLGKSIEELGIPVVYLEMETPAQFYRDLVTIGRLLGSSERAKQVTAFYQQIEQQIVQAAAGLADSQRPRVLLLQYSNKGGEVAFNIPPAAWLQTWMIEAAGGAPVWKDAVQNGGWTVVTFEQIAAWNPDVVLLVDYKGNAPAVVQGLGEDIQWQLLPAMQAGKVYPFPTDFLSWDQPDPRWILGLQWLGTVLQPELFETLDMNTAVNNFYSELYGLDAQTIQTIIAEKLKDYPLTLTGLKE